MKQIALIILLVCPYILGQGNTIPRRIDALETDVDSLYTKTSHIVTPQMFGAVGDSTTDCYTAFNDAVNFLFDNDGGELTIPAGNYVIDSLWELPRSLTASGDNPYNGKPLKITGAGAFMSGRNTNNVPIGGTVLILKYAGSEGYKIFTQGNANVEISGITFYSPGTDSNAFILTTNTNLHINNCAFWGARTGTSANQDAIILGGTYTGNPARGDSSGFQGYGTVIRDNYFNKIRRAVYGRAFANSVVFSDNNIWNSCGSNLGNGAAIEFDGLNALPVQNNDAGGMISGNLIEMPSYPYAIKLKNASHFSLIGNNLYDPSVITQGFYYLDTSAVYNYIQRGYHSDAKPMFVEINSGSNTIIDYGASQYSYFSQRLDLDIVRFSTTNSPYWVNPSDVTQDFDVVTSFSPQPYWYLRYIDTTGATPEIMLQLTRASSTNHYLNIYGSEARIVAPDASASLRLHQGSGGTLWLGVVNNLSVSSAGVLTSSLSTGTAPFSITSTTAVDNLTVKRISTPSFIGDAATDLDMGNNDLLGVQTLNLAGTQEDTTGLNARDIYIDGGTNQLYVVRGANLVVNGDFDDWTDIWSPTGWNVSNDDSVNRYVEESPTGQLHFYYEAQADTQLFCYQTGATIGVTYGYSFEVKSISGLVDVTSVLGIAGGVLEVGIYAGEFTATSAGLFQIKSYTDTSTCDLVIDNIKVWQKTGGDKQLPIFSKTEFHPILNPAIDDTMDFNFYDDSTTVDSIHYKVDDSLCVNWSFGSNGWETNMITTPDTLTGEGTITTLNNAGISARNELQMYFIYIGDTAVNSWFKIYRRE